MRPPESNTLPRFSPELKALHGGLSAAFAAFLDFAERDPEVYALHKFNKFEESPLMHYDLHRWPTLIDLRRSQLLEEMSLGVCRLIKRAPRRLFGGDAGRAAAYYGLPLERAQVALEALALTDDARGAISRGDFIDSAGGMKCLEFNLTAGLGGWETALQAQLVMEQPALQRFAKERGLVVHAQDTLHVLFKHLLEDMRRSVIPWEGECNLGVLFPDNDTPDAVGIEMATLLLNHHLKEVWEPEGVKGEVLIGTYSEVRDADGQRFTLRGKRLHGVLEHDARDRLKLAGPEFDARARSALGARTLCLYNGPAQELLDDKRNITLLSEHAESPLLSDAERELIRRHIPWSRKLERAHTTRGGARVWLPDLASARREELVLKAGRDYAGHSVRMGWATPAAEWDEAIRAALDSGGWVLQERVESQPYHYLRADGGVGPHNLIWGPFVFGDLYGGTMVRMNPAGRGTGIVNTRQGATMCALVIAEEAQQAAKG